MKKIIIIASVSLIVGLSVGAGVVYLINRQGVISIDEARERAISAANQLIPNANADATGIVVEGGLYKITLSIQGREEVIYLNKSGSLLFPQVINLNDLLDSPTPAPEAPSPTFTEEQVATLANCLTEKGVRFFGTAECPWCTEQKELFGQSAELLPYIECSLDVATEEELAMCREANVEGVPDWRFPGQEPVTGMQSIQRIAELSGCEI